MLSVLHRLNIGHGANTNFSSSGPIGLQYTAFPEYGGSGRKVRSLDERDDFIQCCLPVRNLILDKTIDRSYDFPQIMRRNIGRHTDRNALGTVDQ